jgi:UDP-3-O-[3-hydroxymyristoyl] glucosamine N-acyltransferase
MIDQRFYCRRGPIALALIAAKVGGEISPPQSAEIMVGDIAAPECATPDQITVFSDPRFLGACRDSRALAVVTSPKLASQLPDKALLIAPDPRLAFAMTAHLFYPVEPPAPGIDAQASVDAGASMGEGCRVEAGARIGAGVRLGARCLIGAGAVLGVGVEIGDDGRIDANATVSHAVLGARATIGSGTVVGGAGFGYVPGPGGVLRVPQLGRVLIGDDVEIGNNCAIDRGALGDTRIGTGTKIDNLVHLAHNVQIGRYCIITAQVGIAGSSTVGDGTMIGGQAAVADHVHIGARVRIVAQSGIIRDIPDGETVGGSPALPVRDWHRQTVALAKLTGIKPGGRHG